jgi:hypothetical protein
MMTDILEQHWEPSRDAVESSVGDETVILHLTNGTYYGLDAVGTRIWALLKEGSPPPEICARIAEEYDVAPNVAEADARRFLEDLKANGIIEEA